MSISITQETITPELAAKYLAGNTHNRTMAPNRVETFRRDIDAGAWSLNGESIKFADDGKLLDGQHRLTAVVQAGKPIVTVVVRGLDDEAQATVDTGAKRTFGNVLGLAGERNCNTLAAGVRVAHTVDTYGMIRTTLAAYASTSELLGYFAKNPGLRESALLGVQAGHSSLKIQSGIATGLHYLMSRIDPKLADTFWQNMLEDNTVKGDAIYALRESLIRDLGRPHHISTVWKAALIIKAWNYWLEGRADLNYIMWRGGGPAPEPYPTLRKPSEG